MPDTNTVKEIHLKDLDNLILTSCKKLYNRAKFLIKDSSL